MARIGFVVNPIAGMGGRVGLKGTDDAAKRAAALGAEPSSERKALFALMALKRRLATYDVSVQWLTAGGTMGADCLAAAGFNDFEVVYDSPDSPSADDTKSVAACFLQRRVELVLFCGGDGTARDICGVVGQSIPLLGIPAGVKMYSGVFATSPTRTAEILERFLRGELAIGSADILDLDEEKYRRGQWEVRLCDVAQVPIEPAFVQAAKSVIAGVSEAESKREIAQTIHEDAGRTEDTLYILGPGSTLAAVGERFGIVKTLLGIDAVKQGKQVGTDLNEQGLLALLENAPASKLVVSPIGAQGFVLGRGNLQLSPQVLRRIGTTNLIIVATPGKLARTPTLRFDTGDASLDEELSSANFLPVVVGYRQRRLVHVAA